VFDFSRVAALPLLYGTNVIRNIQQVTTEGDLQVYNPLDILSKDESSPVEQQFNNDVLNKENRE
jgi:hypothetical protein